MYPYKRRLRWLVSNRYDHIATIVGQNPRLYAGDHGDVLRRRVHAMRAWNRARGVVLALLSLGAITATVSGLVASFGEPSVDPTATEAGSAVVDAWTWITRVASSLSGLFLVVLFFVNRTLGQIEADLLTSLAVEHVKSQ